MRPKDEWPQARERALRRARELVLSLIGPRDAAVYLFGSCARGEASTSSDIDIAIDPRPGFPPGLLSEIREALEESTIPYNVDVIDLASVDAEFKARILKDAVLWRA
jgi:uncharacterized protein